MRAFRNLFVACGMVFCVPCLLFSQERWDDLPRVSDVDVCVYGATSAGIIAAITARHEGCSVLLVEPGERIGGLTAGGLGFTDIGRVEIIKGLALDFYSRVGKCYGADAPVFKFEPKVALSVYRQMLQAAGVDVTMSRRICKVVKKENRLREITLERASKRVKQRRATVRAKVFIDCSYEGDLMARAGVSYVVGRESSATYGESYNGLQMRDKHQFPDGVDPYVEKGNPASGLLYGILPGEMGQTGQADKRVQAYNFRLTLTNDPANRLPITRPARYDSTRYELLLRLKEVQPWRGLNDCFKWDRMPNNKTDVNNNGAFSTDMIGENWDYPEASYKKRERLHRAHLDYTLGLLYFVGHDARVPEFVRREIGEWGLPRDEYEEHGHFTPQLYIRESRRMVGPYVMTQGDCLREKVPVSDAVGWAAYNMDSHNTGRYVVNGMVKNEGDVQIRLPGAYGVSYRSVTPFEAEACNLLVPVCLSASHIAYGSIRMEPVFMVLGESAAIAASLAIRKCDGVVQRVSHEEVMQRFAEIK